MTNYSNNGAFIVDFMLTFEFYKAVLLFIFSIHIESVMFFKPLNIKVRIAVPSKC